MRLHHNLGLRCVADGGAACGPDGQEQKPNQGRCKAKHVRRCVGFSEQELAPECGEVSKEPGR